MEQEPITQKQGEVDLLFRLTPGEDSRARTKKKIIRRLTRIERLAKQKNYDEIQKLLRENYV